MTRMPRKLLPFFSILALVFSLGVVGCGPDAKDKKIEDLSAENDQLKREMEDRERQLSDAAMRENDAKGTIDQLNQALAKARSEGGKGKDGEWVSFNNFDMMNVPGSVLFESGRAELTGSGRSKLAQIASDIRARYGDRDIYVFGHTDDQPIRKSKWKDNWELGAHRALTVIRALHDSGVPYQSLVQANCGEHRPKVPNAGAEKNRSQNRRVEFYAVKRKSGLADESITRSLSSSDEE